MEKVLEVCVIYMLIFATLELLCLKQETSSIIDDMCRKMQIHSLNPGGGGGGTAMYGPYRYVPL